MTSDTPTPEPDRSDRPAGPDDATREGPAAAPPEDPTVVRPPAAEPAEPGLYRSQQDRMLFGVCGGIAERYGFEPLLVRLAFVATLFIGGAGVLFYLAAAILIPKAPITVDGQPTPDAAHGALGAANGLLRLLVGIAVVLGIFVGLGIVGALSFAVTIFCGAWPVTIVLVVLAGLLALNARSRRTTGSLLVLVLALALPAAAAVLSDISVDRSAGERHVHVDSIAEARQGYRLGMGQMTLDLRDLRPRPGTVATVPARVDLGSLRVILPPRQCVTWRIRTQTRFGEHRGLVADPSSDVTWGARSRYSTLVLNPGGASDRPEITLNLRVGAGEIAVANSLQELDRLDHHGRWDVTDHRDGSTSRTTEACRTAKQASATRP